MDSGLIVAIVSLVGSFLTVLVTSLSSFLTKRLESKQKVNEHKLAIRSLYVTKKMEAGQAFVSANNEKIHELEFFIQQLGYFNDQEMVTQKVMDKAADAPIEIQSLFQEKDNFTYLFFDMSAFKSRSNVLVEEINYNLRVLEENGRRQEGQEFSERIISLRTIAAEQIGVRELMNAYVREDLAKYDVL
jgi:hypothetical protein